MDGLVPDDASARFPNWCLLGLLPDTRRATKLASYPRYDCTVRQALSIAGRGADRPKVSVWKSPNISRYSCWHRSLPVFRARNRATIHSKCGGVVSACARAYRLPGERNGAIRRVAWPAGLLTTEWPADPPALTLWRGARASQLMDREISVPSQ